MICCISVNRFRTIPVLFYQNILKYIDKNRNIEQKACNIQKKTLPLSAILGKRGANLKIPKFVQFGS